MSRAASARGRAVIVIAVLAIAALVAAGPAAANIAAPGGAWFWQNPVPQGNAIGGLWFVDANNGWAVGSAGTILRTNDAGATWTAQTSPVREELVDVAFFDSRTGWAVSTAGSVLSTTDGGTTWTAQGTGVGGALNKLCVLDDKTVYIVGDGGVILRTTDGGVTPWVRLSSPTLANLNAITFRTPSIGWAVGEGGRVLRTNNSGLSWFFGTSGTAADLNDVAFASLFEGWAVGNGGAVRHTINGGASWSDQGIGGGDDLTRIALATSGAWVAGSGGRIASSTDGGVNWDNAASGTNRDLWALSVSGADVRVAGNGGFYSRAVDGVTFMPAWETAAGQQLNGIAFSDATAVHGWAVGAGGTVLRTADTGANWFRQESGLNLQLNDVAAASFTTGDSTHAWVVGNRPGAGQPGTILTTSNGGLTWDQQTSGVSNATLNGVDFISLTVGWAVGNSVGGTPTLLTTGTGGATWSGQASGAPGAANLTSVDATSATNACLTYSNGGTGGVRYTINGGTTAWLGGTVPGGTPDLEDVDMIESSPLVGYAVGDAGTILKTVDAGVNWTAQTSNTPQDLYGVAFASDGSSGVAVGDAGTVVTTTDGGATWTVDPWSFNVDLRAADGIVAASRWICGTGGAILSSFNPNALAVTNLKGSPGDSRITVSWTNPVTDFGGVMVYFSTVRCASSVNDTYGQQVAYEGTGTSLVRTGLQNNTAYYFTVFVRNTVGTWSNAQTLVLVPIPTFKPTLTVKPSVQAAGRAIRFSGKVSPAATAAGSYVLIQRYTGSWKTFAKARVGSSGSYAVSKSLSRGTYKVRAYMPGTAKALAGSSPSRYVTWR